MLVECGYACEAVAAPVTLVGLHVLVPGHVTGQGGTVHELSGTRRTAEVTLSAVGLGAMYIGSFNHNGF